MIYVNITLYHDIFFRYASFDSWQTSCLNLMPSLPGHVSHQAGAQSTLLQGAQQSSCSSGTNQAWKQFLTEHLLYSDTCTCRDEHRREAERAAAAAAAAAAAEAAADAPRDLWNASNSCPRPVVTEKYHMTSYHITLISHDII